MGKKVRSARGVIVDFDLMKVKQEIANAQPVDVSDRTAFVEKRLRRRTKRTATPTVAPKVEEPAVEEVEAEVDDFEQELAAETQEKAARPVRKKS